MSLHVDHYGGTGAPLLFIHGWGMHGGMWGDILPQLAMHFKVMAVDLPGHGLSGKGEECAPSALKGEGCGAAVYPFPLPSSPFSINPSPFSLENIVDQLSAQFTGPLTVCGWSLGAQVALRWAMRYPAQVQRLVLVSSTPCFVQQDNWLCAMAADTLAAFSAALQQDYAQTLRRFLALQVRGSEQERELLASLRKLLPGRGEPDLAALQSGLEILRTVDFRAALPLISHPALVIAGDRDTLTPLAAAQYMALKLPDARLAVIEGAAHAPFLSHPEIFVKQVVSFLHE